MVRKGRSAELSRSPHHPEQSRGKARRRIRQDNRIYRDFIFASRCRLGSGFLDTSICKACGQRPLGHRGWPA
ncbi:MAG TPA: hypothetical protein VMW72_17480 [Sedimentisphaerales bacterium]|nr:hypothetical protein [Sedimentisphaerales bacterium]